jgi:hypothetical protein
MTYLALICCTYDHYFWTLSERATFLFTSISKAVNCVFWVCQEHLVHTMQWDIETKRGLEEEEEPFFGLWWQEIFEDDYH